MIRAGRVSVDGRVVSELGTKIDPAASVIAVDGKPLRRQALRYVLLNKPSGYITTTKDERGRRTVMDLVPGRERLYPVGRLDRDTEGLLLLTNDGDVAHRVMHPRHELAKEYHVVTLARPSESTARRVRDGVMIDGRRVVPDEFRILRETREGILLKIVIHEGMYHAVRRLMDAVGISVKTLRRVRLGPLSVAGLSVGECRDLTDGERTTLFEALRLTRDLPTSSGSHANRPERPRPVTLGGWLPGRRPAASSSAPTPSAAVKRRDTSTIRGEAQPGQRAGRTTSKSPTEGSGPHRDGFKPGPARGTREPDRRTPEREPGSRSNGPDKMGRPTRGKTPSRRASGGPDGGRSEVQRRGRDQPGASPKDRAQEKRRAGQRTARQQNVKPGHPIRDRHVPAPTRRESGTDDHRTTDPSNLHNSGSGSPPPGKKPSRPRVAGRKGHALAPPARRISIDSDQEH